MLSLTWTHLLILVIAANSAPVLLTRFLGDRFTYPIDGGKQFFDHRPVFGKSKTWRGFIAALVACAIIAPLLNYSVLTGIYAALLAMFGDLCSSFTKRRLGLPSSAQAPLIDQVPEALLPAIVLRSVFTMSWLDVASLTMAFFALEIIFSIVFYWLGIRQKPY